MAGKESTPSEKAADRIHADLSAMYADAERHRANAQDSEVETNWGLLSKQLMRALGASHACMSDRDRRIAQNG